MTNRLKASLSFVILLLILIVPSGRGGPPMQFAPLMMGGGPVVTDWSTRVVANGGALPSQNTIGCMETLRASLVSLGLTNKIYSLCIFVPDSVIAATTPLIKHYGFDPWANSNFVSGDLNVYGLKGDGTTKLLDSGVKPKDTIGLTSFGLTTIVTESAFSGSSTLIGFQGLLGVPFYELATGGSALGSTVFAPGDISGGAATFISTNDAARVGYISGNKVTNSSAFLFVASPLEAHKIFSIKTNGPVTASVTEDTFNVFSRKLTGTNSGFNASRVSVAAIHNWFTEVESSNFWWAVKTCRECLGGGTGDPVHDWAVRVLTNGGTAISVNTSNSLRTFRQGLETDGLLYKMISANTFVPDNLTAARMPFLFQAGLPIWTNLLFDSTNLTVNGLTGNGSSKLLGTGLNPAGVGYAGFGSSNAGISVLLFNVTATACFELAGSGVSPNSFFSVDSDGAGANLLRFSSFKFVNVNTNFVLRAKGTSWTNGWLSGNRTASNAVAMYWVTNSVHNVATNSTVLMTSGTPTITNMFAFAAANPAGPANFSDRTVSFLSLHPGLSQTEDSNLWVRVKNLRTAFGGGVPP